MKIVIQNMKIMHQVGHLDNIIQEATHMSEDMDKLGFIQYATQMNVVILGLVKINGWITEK